MTLMAAGGNSRNLLCPLALVCYGAAWWVFQDHLAKGAGSEHLVQVGVTVLFLAVFSLLGFLASRLAAVLSAALQSLGILYLALAMGPVFLGLGLSVIPTLLLVGWRFSPFPAGLFSILPLLGVGAAFVPHRVWETEYPGATPAEYGALAVFFICFLLLGFLLRRAEATITRQEKELGRLDFGFQNIAQANLELQTYALFARQEAVDQERRRVAGEIHDIVGYTLTNVIILIQTALALNPPKEKVHSILEQAAAQATDGLSEARRALALLRSRSSSRPHGANLYHQLVRRFSEATGVKVRLHFGNLPQLLPSSVEQVLFRIIQEGLTNSFRHGKASSVEVGFWNEDGAVTLDLMDNGVGAEVSSDPGRRGGGIGLTGLSELVEGLGGTFSGRAVEGGFALRAVVPLRDQPP
jgi:signal transduction histidine kinase